MITREQNRDEYLAFRPSDFGLPEKSLYFDIETTGFSAYSSQLYLIGVLYEEEGSMKTRQWLAESFAEEQAVLRAFFSFAEAFDALVSYNGEGFDLRYLKDCADQYRLPFSLNKLIHIDLMKECRKSKKLTGLTSFRLEAVEAFLGIKREDLYSGGELIPVYERFTAEKKEEQLKLLLLHNLEDIEGLLGLLPMLSYNALLAAPDIRDLRTVLSEDGALILTASIPQPVPVSVVCSLKNGNRLSLRDKTIELEVPLSFGTLRRYYRDFRSYDFLIDEGYAIHRKLSAFVDASKKVPATKETCYTLYSGQFAALPAGYEPEAVFKERYDAKTKYAEASKIDPEAYLLACLKEL